MTRKEANLLPHGGELPAVAPSAWVAPGAFVIGAVELGADSSVWYGAVLRGDTEPVRIGARTNVQDGCVLHADPGFPATVGEGCVVGHNAVVHGCEVGDGCLVGMGATILNGAKIGAGSIVAAGAVVPEGREFPPRSLVVGVPAKRVGDVADEQAQDIERGAREYVERAAAHRDSLRAVERERRRLMTIATADLYDEHADDLETCETQFRQYGAVAAFHGEIATVECFEDNVLVRQTLSESGSGRVLVVDGGGSLRAALVGDIIAGLALENGWAGIVLNGAVRDVAALREVGIGLKALGSNPRKSAKMGAGETGVTVAFGGARFVPGQWVYCDEDGVIVAPRRLDAP